MRNSFYLFISLIIYSCSLNPNKAPLEYELPTVKHDLGYIPFDSNIDDEGFTVCDSTNINSGRNRLQYTGGSDQLRADIRANYQSNTAYADFSGYVVIRFIVNCNGKSGRYRAQSLNLDFSPSKENPDLLKNSITLIQDLDQWVKSPKYDDQTEYSKFINLKIDHGQLQHVLL
ncbi:MAG: hypothetical protein AAF242_01285 [Bacteroidota bacterium]